MDWKQVGDLPRIVRAYIDYHRDPLKVAQEKIRDLEERLARANKTIENLNPQHKGLPGGR